MTAYIIKLRYLNTYHGFKFKIDGKAFNKVDSGFVESRYEKSEVDDNFILFFETYFTPYIKRVTYNDIVSSDDYKLEIYKLNKDENAIIIHKVSWSSPETEDYLHIITVEEGGLKTDFLKFEEGLKKIGELGLEFSADFGA